MFFLVTGASGAGKSTVRRLVEPEFDGHVVTAELATLGITPEWSLRWRHQVLERVVQQALQVQQEGQHFLLCGDPIPPGELYAVPSADQLDHVEVCLLDVSADEQRRRLIARGDDPELIPRHIAFAEWMRHHVVDHRHRPEVIMQDGWREMRWDRWLNDEQTHVPWRSYRIDTTTLQPADVAERVAAWIRLHDKRIDYQKRGSIMSNVRVRYLVHDVDEAVDFYTRHLGFEVLMHPAPGFAALQRDGLRLLLNAPGAGGAGQAMPDGRTPEPGGWNRIQLEVEDLTATVNRLRQEGATFRNEVVSGRGGKQILLEDPAGNPVELFEPHER